MAAATSRHDQPRDRDGRWTPTDTPTVTSGRVDALVTAPVDAADENQIDEVVWLMAKNERLDEESIEAMKNIGVTAGEAVAAYRSGIKIHRYIEGRTLGVAHDDLLDAHARGWSMRWYVNVRAGAAGPHDADVRYPNGTVSAVSHAQICELADHGIEPKWGATGLRAGATIGELVEANAAGADLWVYSRARSDGTSHREFIDRILPQARIDDSPADVDCDSTGMVNR